MPQGYDGLPSYYSGSSNPITPNLGLSLIGMDPIIAEDFVLIDMAFGSIGSSIKVNGSIVNNPNFVDSASISFNVLGSNISLTAGSGGSGFPTRFVTVTSAYIAVAGDFVLCDTSAGGFTVTMPLSTSNAKRNICVKKVSLDVNVLTLATSGSDTIDLQSTQIVTQQNTAVLMVADGSAEWMVY
jgi:hypothetical protein